MSYFSLKPTHKWYAATGEKMNMTDMILSRGEVVKLTGYQRPSRQIAWLRKNGLRFFVGADGYPRVPRANLEIVEKTRGSEPDFGSLKQVR